MERPGLADAERDLFATADDKAAELLEELKKEVQAEAREIGTLRQELKVTVPAKVIASHIEHNYEELRQDAQIPGFRKGRAPRQLIEKRFGHDVRESLKTMIIGQSYFAAIENLKLEALGDPLFRIAVDGGEKLMGLDEALGHVTLPAEGDFAYTCELEIKPSFELPELKGIPVQSVKVEITDAQVDERIDRLQKVRGRYEPLTDEPAQADDLLVADVTLKVGDQEVKREENVSLGVRGTRLDGVQLPNLGEVLTGARPGDTRSVDCTIPDDYERADLRGQAGRFEFAIREAKRLAPIPMEKLVEQVGATDAAQLRQFVREDIESESDEQARRAEREQVCEYLLAQVAFDLPEQLSARQTDRALLRRVLEARQMGLPEQDIEARIDEMRAATASAVVRDLKLAFILEKVAEQLGVEVTDEEVNTAIAQIARRYGRRFDRVRDELQSSGMLGRLADQIREDKCVEQLLAEAQRTPAKGDPA
jgi:trigger factor